MHYCNPFVTTDTGTPPSARPESLLAALPIAAHSPLVTGTFDPATIGIL